MRKIAFVVLMPWMCLSQGLISTIEIDTSQYERAFAWATYGPNCWKMQPFGCVRKGRGQVDIYDYLHGKIATSTVPSVPAGYALLSMWGAKSRHPVRCERRLETTLIRPV